jgi:dienelactone hydrolase
MRKVIMLVCAALLALASCGQDTKDGGLKVTSEVVSDATTQDVLVVGPDAQGSWPVVLALHGVDGSGGDMGEIATRLGQQGTVVFAPTYRTDIGTQRGIVQAVRDIECGYRFARSIAADYAGDLDQPVTFVGWSLGATGVLALGLTEEIDPSGKHITCFKNMPRPDVIVAISGCYYEYAGAPSTFDPSGWGNEDAQIVLVAGEKDTTCAAWQSKKAADELRAAGYDVDLVTLEGASHYAPIFHDLQDGQFVVVPDDPAGDRTVGVILDAIAARQDRT